MRKFGLIGKTLQHSFSKKYFTEKFSKLEILAEYENFELDSIEDFPSLIKNQDISGFNVTVPYKESIIPFLDELNPVAEEIGAVNTITFKGGKTIGYNTDIIGFKNSIKPFLKHGQERALILGTGGASKAVEYVLRNLGVDVIYLSRNPDKSIEFAYQECNDIMINACKIIINTTPLGTFPAVEECPDIPYQHISYNHLCYDLVYNPPETMFIKKAKAQGANTVNGLTMLQIQAEEAWKIWNQ